MPVRRDKPIVRLLGFKVGYANRAAFKGERLNSKKLMNEAETQVLDVPNQPSGNGLSNPDEGRSGQYGQFSIQNSGLSIHE